MQIIGEIRVIKPLKQVNRQKKVQSVILRTDRKKYNVFQVDFYNQEIDLTKNLLIGQNVKIEAELLGDKMSNKNITHTLRGLSLETLLI